MENVAFIQEGVSYPVPKYGTQTGALLTMRDGEIWFHPYNGAPPVRVPFYEVDEA